MHAPTPDFIFDHRDDAARHYWWVPEVARGPGQHTQWLEFRIRPGGMAAHSPASHFAIVLRAHLGRDAEGRPLSISGRGMTFGDTSQAYPLPGNVHALEPGFGGARGCQIESFWQGGNFLYRDSALLPDGLSDELWYTVRLEVDDDRHVSLMVLPDGGAVQAARLRDRAAHPVQEGAGGILIGLGRGPAETGPWRAEFRDIACGWR